MRYLKFTINNYRAINGPLEIDLDRKSLIPIIGINESGKTTILQAIFAFDYYNDELNENGRHLKDTTNLYRSSSPPAEIEAEIEATKSEVASALENEDDQQIQSYGKKIRRWRKFPNSIRISRNLKTVSYAIPSLPQFDPATADLIAKAIIRNLPYILYFDDFRDKVDEKFEIIDSKKSFSTGWLAIIEQLFDQTERGLSLFSLPEMDDRQRKGVLAKVERHLNKTLTREWQHFQLDDTEALLIAIGFLEENLPNNLKRNYLTIDVVETDTSGDKHFFHVSDRSKGFFWFFNFVMKLEFNPKIVSQDDRNTIYLLDEPGSYLHASAQTKLCTKLKNLSEKNRVVYCTHSHYLLDPEKIPLGNIFVADKDGSGNINLISIYNYKGTITEKRSAFQPVLDALKIRPFVLETLDSPVLITEGIFEYYCLELFKASRSIKILPTVGADSIKYYVSLMICWSVPFKALWDNDATGRKHRIDAQKIFGEEFARDRLHLLPLMGHQRNCILQDLFEGSDLVMFRKELGISEKASFEKTILTVFYSKSRAELMAKVSKKTYYNFTLVFQSLSI